jgi:hypothetical protein
VKKSVTALSSELPPENASSTAATITTAIAATTVDLPTALLGSK